jgi:hypothetical protein
MRGNDVGLRRGWGLGVSKHQHVGLKMGMKVKIKIRIKSKIKSAWHISSWIEYFPAKELTGDAICSNQQRKIILLN